MPLQSHVDANCFVHIPPNLTESESPATVLFYITGNPGLIAYYHTFLSLLATSPKPSVGSVTTAEFDTSQCVIVGFSLAGFEVEETEGGGVWKQRPFTLDRDGDQHREYTLREQVHITFSRLIAVLDLLRSDHGRSPQTVVLMGHSVGAYVALEVVRLLGIQQSEVKVAACVLLTPTIVDIATSQSGRVAAPLLSNIPFLPGLVQIIVRGLSVVVGYGALGWLVARITGMPAESECVDATVRFLRSRRGVGQALSMAGDEMREITSDRWGEEVWGVVDAADVVADATMGGESVSPSDPAQHVGVGQQADAKGNGEEHVKASDAPSMFFLFAHTDHWVADATREEITQARKGKARSRVVVEEEGKLVHGWCISQSAHVAERVRGWVGEEVARAQSIK